jgi:hypothetical protein
MGRVESEQVVVHHSSDSLQPWLGFGFHHLGPIYQFLNMYVGICIPFLTSLTDLFYGSWCSALSRIQWMFHDIRQQRCYFSMDHTTYMGLP